MTTPVAAHVLAFEARDEEAGIEENLSRPARSKTAPRANSRRNHQVGKSRPRCWD
jgi:hypothetical protein